MGVVRGKRLVVMIGRQARPKYVDENSSDDEARDQGPLNGPARVLPAPDRRGLDRRDGENQDDNVPNAPRRARQVAAPRGQGAPRRLFSQLESCANCGNQAPAFACDGCHTVGYCDKGCQTKDWATHVDECINRDH